VKEFDGRAFELIGVVGSIREISQWILDCRCQSQDGWSAWLSKCWCVILMRDSGKEHFDLLIVLDPSKDLPHPLDLGRYVSRKRSEGG
jgi:hypothetical protein